MTVVLAISSTVLALNGALEASPMGTLSSTFAVEAISGALEAVPSAEPPALELAAPSESNPYVAAIRVVFPIFEFGN